jgi:hypothetical protein
MRAQTTLAYTMKSDPTYAYREFLFKILLAMIGIFFPGGGKILLIYPTSQRWQDNF